MKQTTRIAVILGLALLPVFAAAQVSGYDVTATGGFLKNPNRDHLVLQKSTVIAFGTDYADGLGTLLTTENDSTLTGSVSISVQGLTSGTLADGGVFGAGGTYSVTVSDSTGTLLTVTATINPGATWQKVTLANGSHNYTLSGTMVTSQGNYAAFVLLTSNIGRAKFSGQPIAVSVIDQFISTSPTF